MNYFQSFDSSSARIKGVKTLYFSGPGTFPQFSAGHGNLPCDPRPNCLLRERQLLSPQDHVWLLVNTCFLYSGSTHAHFYYWCCFSGPLSLIMNLCSLYSNKCLRLAYEKFVLASGSNLSLATGLASWKVSLEPCFTSAIKLNSRISLILSFSWILWIK